MKCYVDAREGANKEAVAVCSSCGMGLCVEHVVDQEMLLSRPPGLAGYPERGMLILCERCAEARQGLTAG